MSISLPRSSRPWPERQPVALAELRDTLPRLLSGKRRLPEAEAALDTV